MPPSVDVMAGSGGVVAKLLMRLIGGATPTLRTLWRKLGRLLDDELKDASEALYRLPRHG
jgi:hypothetical protein